jgi:hypothetical protein
VTEGLDQEHARWLCDGSSSWNAFRRDVPDLTPLLDGLQ